MHTLHAVYETNDNIKKQGLLPYRPKPCEIQDGCVTRRFTRMFFYINNYQTIGIESPVFNSVRP